MLFNDTLGLSSSYLLLLLLPKSIFVVLATIDWNNTLASMPWCLDKLFTTFKVLICSTSNSSCVYNSQMQPHGAFHKKILICNEHHHLQLPTFGHFFLFCLHNSAKNSSSLVRATNSSQCDPNDDPKKIFWLLRTFNDEGHPIANVIMFLGL